MNRSDVFFLYLSFNVNQISIPLERYGPLVSPFSVVGAGVGVNRPNCDTVLDEIEDFFKMKFLQILTILLLATASVFAQTNSSQKNKDKTNRAGELILDEILIEAVLEKPNVSIFANRERPRVGSSEFTDRSFQKELGELPGKKILFREDFFKIKKIHDYKKLIKTIVGKQPNK